MPFTGILLSSRLVATWARQACGVTVVRAVLYANHRLGRHAHLSAMSTSTTASRTRDYSEFNLGHDETMAQRVVCNASPHAEIRPVERFFVAVLLYGSIAYSYVNKIERSAIVHICTLLFP